MQDRRPRLTHPLALEADGKWVEQGGTVRPQLSGLPADKSRPSRRAERCILP